MSQTPSNSRPSTSNILKSLASVHLPPPPSFISSVSPLTPPQTMLHHNAYHRSLQMASFSNKENIATGYSFMSPAQPVIMSPGNSSPLFERKIGHLGHPNVLLPSAHQLKLYHPQPQHGQSDIPAPEDMPPIVDDGSKPPYSYATLIGMAILRSADRKLTLSQIYKWINNTFSWYQTKTGWQNSIRHNLSLNKAFKKQERPKGDPGKGHYWVVVKGCEFQFIRVRTTKRPPPPIFIQASPTIPKPQIPSQARPGAHHSSRLPDLSHLQSCAAVSMPKPKPAFTIFVDKENTAESAPLKRNLELVNCLDKTNHKKQLTVDTRITSISDSNLDSIEPSLWSFTESTTSLLSPVESTSALLLTKTLTLTPKRTQLSGGAVTSQSLHLAISPTKTSFSSGLLQSPISAAFGWRIDEVYSQFSSSMSPSKSHFSFPKFNPRARDENNSHESFLIQQDKTHSDASTDSFTGENYCEVNTCKTYGEPTLHPDLANPEERKEADEQSQSSLKTLIDVDNFLRFDSPIKTQSSVF